MTGPDHRSPGCAERRHPRYGRSNIPPTDIAENTADENQISRDGAGVGTGERCIALHHLDLLVHPGRSGTSAGEMHQSGVQFDQARPHVGATPMDSDDVDHVAPLPGAHAHDPDGSGRVVVQDLAHAHLHQPQPHGNGRIGILVHLVPTHPVAIVVRHPAAPAAVCDSGGAHPVRRPVAYPVSDPVSDPGGHPGANPVRLVAPRNRHQPIVG